MSSTGASESPSGFSPSVGEELNLADRMCGDVSAIEDFARSLGDRARGAHHSADVAALFPRRVNADQATVEKNLSKLVLALVDLVRQLVERQAIRRVNAGSLTEDEIERMGETFLKLEKKMSELKTAFGLEGEDLNLSLGPIREML